MKKWHSFLFLFAAVFSFLILQTPAFPDGSYSASSERDLRNGWKCAYNNKHVWLKHSADGMHWSFVTPPLMNALAAKAKSWGGDSDTGLISCDFFSFDNRSAWAAFHNEGPDGAANVSVFRTVDGGKQWTSVHLKSPIIDVGGGCYIAFSDRRHGGILICSSQGCGLMSKAVYRTSDGGRHWRFSSCSDGVPGCRSPHPLPGVGYPTGFSANSPKSFWVAQLYRTHDYIELYHSIDAGRTWRLVKLSNPPIPAKFHYRYSDCYPPQFYGPGLRFGKMKVEEAGDAHADIYYWTRDGGGHWRPGKANVLKN